jgi:hypothetical protein
METQNVSNSDNKAMSAIERALAAAKARKAMKADAGITHEVETAAEPVKAKAPKVKAEKPVDETKAAAKAEKAAAREAKIQQLKADRAARKEAKAAARAEKVAAKAATKGDRKPAHMKKVEKARARLAPLNSEAQVIFGDVTANFSAAMIDAIAQHLLVHNRAMATIKATAAPRLPVGTQVRITGGDARFIGMVGVVTQSQALRAMVLIEGVKKPLYIYNSQAEPAAATADMAAAG